jgi:hypothetical protein
LVGDRTGAVLRVFAVCVDLVLGGHESALSLVICSWGVLWRRGESW